MSTPTRPIVVSLARPLMQMATPVPIAASQLQISPGRPVLIESNGFVLRSLTPGDADLRMLSWLSNEQMMQGLNLASLDFDLDQLRGFIGRFDNFRSYFIGIFAKSDGLLIGFYTIDVDLKHRIGQVTTGIGESRYEGKGTLWATFGALLSHFYAERNIEKFSAHILARNFRMLFNFRNNPLFIFEACLQQECLAPNGERLDILVFSSFKNPRASDMKRPST